MIARGLHLPKSLAGRLLRSVRLLWANWQLQCLREERELYTQAGLAGPIYQRNSRTQELSLLRRISQIEGL